MPRDSRTNSRAALDDLAGRDRGYVPPEILARTRCSVGDDRWSPHRAHTSWRGGCFADAGPHEEVQGPPDGSRGCGACLCRGEEPSDKDLHARPERFLGLSAARREILFDLALINVGASP